MSTALLPCISDHTLQGNIAPQAPVDTSPQSVLTQSNPRRHETDNTCVITIRLSPSYTDIIIKQMLQHPTHKLSTVRFLRPPPCFTNYAMQNYYHRIVDGPLIQTLWNTIISQR